MSPAHAELSAGGVEFDASKGHGDVESDDFLSDEVVAWSEGAWDGDGDRLASLDVSHVPLSVRLLPELSNLEPSGCGSIELVAAH